MRHLTDDMLLAYIRKQQSHLWPRDIQEHIDICPGCNERFAEFEAVGNTLEAWAHSSASDPRYSTVSNRVMRTLYEPKASSVERERQGVARVGLPIAVVLVLLCMVVLTGLVVNIARIAAQSSSTQPTSGVVPRHPTATPSTPTATFAPNRPTASSVPAGPIATATVVSGDSRTPPYIEVNTPCTTPIDVIQNQLRVCGTAFAPGTTVTIYYQIGPDAKEQHFTQVSADGTFNDVMYIHGCKDVPTAIYVQNSTNPPETAQITKNIVFGTCQSFGNSENWKNNRQEHLQHGSQ